MDDPDQSILEREIHRLRNRVIWSVAGWRDAWRNEHSFRSWIYANAASVCAVLALPLSSTERLIIVTLGILILAAELLNTAIERVVDLASPDRHDLAKRAKDAGSAGVAVAAVAGGVAWIMIVIRLLAD